MSVTVRADAGPGDSGDGPTWPRGPARPVLGRDAVHVWRADLDRIGDELLWALSEQEHARARRFPRRGGVLWARSRGVLRALLGRYLDADPAGLTLQAGPTGRLSLPGPRRLSFNLSHSGPCALYAIAELAPVGVDVELGRPQMNDMAIARRLLGPAVAGRLQALAPGERRREVLRAWTRREALVKCGAACTGAAPPWVIELDVGPSGCAALAVQHTRPPELLCRSWTGA